jgi:hypothetical protein
MMPPCGEPANAGKEVIGTLEAEIIELSMRP